MKRFEKLAYLNTLANECIDDNDLITASKFHNEFMKVAQQNNTYKVTGFRETLNDVADKTGVSVVKLKFYNPSIKGNLVYQGQVLKLGPAAQKDKPGEHTVTTGETGYSIAKQFKIPYKVLEQMNPGRDLNKLYGGDVVKVPVVKSSLETEQDMMAEYEPMLPDDEPMM